MTAKRILRIAGKTLLIMLISVIALVILVWGVLNLAKFAIYSDYYSMKTDVCDNPGLSDGFVCQGICAVEDENAILVSGYMADDSASRIYVTDLESNSYYLSLQSEGEAFDGHAGGIAVWGDRVYIANGSKLYLASLYEVFSSDNGDTLEIGSGVEINNAASFVFADDKYVYVGEFHDGGAYVTDHPYETENGTHYAIMSRYLHEDLSTPDKVYSIRDKVQGMCMTDDGKIVLSTSYGLASSEYFVYNESEATDSGKTLDGAPVYLLTDCIYEFDGPAMAEGLDFSNGSVITLTESASDKYIYGKFFFANKIVALALEQ